MAEAFDPSAFGLKPITPARGKSKPQAFDPAAFGLKPLAPEAAPPGAPDWWNGPPGSGKPDSTAAQIGQNVVEFGKGIPGGAVSMGGSAITGLGASFAGFTRDQVAILDRIDAGETVPEMDDPAGYQHMTPEQRQALRAEIDAAAARPVAELPLVEAGRAVSKAGREMLPAAPGYEESIGRQLGAGAGSLVGGVALSAIPGVGPAIAGSIFTLSGSGEAVERAIEAGATDEQIIEAARLGTIPGMTDSLPVETLLGRVPVPGGKFIKIPANMLGTALKAVGRIGWQTFIEGAQEGGQAFLQNLIARETHSPDQALGEGILPEAAVGGGVGAIAETARQIIASFGGRRRIKPSPEPEPKPQPSAAAPTPQPAPAVVPETAADVAAQQQGRATEAAAASEAGLPPVGARVRATSEGGFDMGGTVEEYYTDPQGVRRARVATDDAGTLEVRLDLVSLAPEQAPAAAPAKPLPKAIRARLAKLGYQPADLAGLSRAAALEIIAQGQPKPTESAAAGGAPEAVPAVTPAAPQPAEVAAPPPAPIQGDGSKGAPAVIQTGADLDAARAANPPAAVVTPGQAETGNFKQTHVRWNGLNVAIETAKGGVREDKANQPPAWRVENFPADYGRFKGVPGRDGDDLDVYMGPAPDAPSVFVVDQIDPEKNRFDEHKVMAGFPDQDSALAAYRQAFSDGSADSRIGAVTPMTVDEFKTWTASGKTKRALAWKRSAEDLAPAPSIHAATFGTPKQQHTYLRRAKDRLEKQFPGRLFIGKDGQQWTLRLKNGTDAENRTIADEVQRQTQMAIDRSKRARERGQRAPESVLEFIASKGGLRDDEGHDLRRSRGAQRAIPGRGMLIRENGRTIDAMGEALWEAGYFGSPGTTPRPTVAEVLDLLDEALAGRDTASEGRQTAAQERAEDRAALATQEAEARARDEIKEVAAEMGEILSAAEIDTILGIMGREGIDAEAAVYQHIERLAIQAADALSSETGDPAYDDIPFEPIEDGDVAGEGRAGQPREEGDAGEGGPGGQAAAEGRGEGRGQEDEVTPAFDPATAIRLVADDVSALRATDLERLFAETDRQHHDDLRVYIVENRPDLAAAALDAASPERKTLEPPSEAFLADQRTKGEAIKAALAAGRRIVMPSYTGNVTFSDPSQIDVRPGGVYVRRGRKWDALPFTTVDAMAQQARTPQSETVDTLDGPREQAVIPGAERISDKELVERRMDAPKRATVAQKPADDGLFDVDGRKQTDLLDTLAQQPKEPAPKPEAQPAPADEDAALLKGLPEGARIDRGHGTLGSKKWGVWLGKDLIGNLEDTKEEAARSAKDRQRSKAEAEASKAERAAKLADVRQRLLDGGEPTDADLKALDLKRSARFEFISPVVQELFGITKPKVRASMGDALRKGFTDHGNEVWSADAKKALMNAAAFAGGKVPAPKPATTAARAPAPAAPGRIEDFGEKLEGARKHYAQAYRDRMKEAADADVSSVPLSKSWPEPDYQKLLDDGADPWIVAFIHAARDEIPAKPSVPWRLKGWVENVTTMRGFAGRLLDGSISKADVQAHLDRPEFARLKRGIGGRVELYEAVGHEKSLKGVRLSEASYSMHMGIEYRPAKIIWTVEREAKATAFGNWPRELASGDTKEAAIAAFKAKIGSIEINPKAEKSVKFDLYSRSGQDGYIVGKKIGKNAIDLKRFDSLKEARTYIAENADELARMLEQRKAIPDHRRETDSPRVGVDHRSGADVTPQAFGETFGFRGVQFGNYVEGQRRQQDLNQAYDGLMDLAGLLGVPPKALSLNGELGLAFGARGTGGKRPAKAHYEPGTIVINLTKNAGAGSLAHEWWHALDNYFSRGRGQKGEFSTEALDVSLASRGSQFVEPTGIRKEMIEAFGAIMRAVNQTALRERSRRLDSRRAKAYWSTGREMTARAFESYIIARLQDQGASNDYLANIVSEEYWNAAEALGVGDGGGLEQSYPYPTAGEIQPIRAAFDQFFDVVQTRETERGVELFARRPIDGRDGAPEDGGAPQEPSDEQTERDLETLRRSIEENLNEGRAEGEWVAIPRGALRPHLLERELQEIASLFGRRVVGFRAGDLPEGGRGEGAVSRSADAGLEGRPAATSDEPRGVAGLVPPEIREFIRSLGGVTLVDHPDVIYLSAHADRPHLTLLGHELVHHLRTDEPDLYQALEDAVMQIVDRSRSPEYIAARMAEGYRAEQIDEEFVADVVADGFTDARFWEALGAANPSALRRIVETIERLIARIREALGGLPVARTGPYLTDFDTVLRIAGQVMGEFARRAGQPADQFAAPDRWTSVGTLPGEMMGEGRAQVVAEIRGAWAGLGMPAENLVLVESISAEGQNVFDSGGDVPNTTIMGATRGQVVAVALFSGAHRDAAYHEGFHALENAGAFSADEMRVFERENERLRSLVAAAFPYLDASVMPPHEVRAYGFQAYMRGAEARGVHVAIRRAWQRLVRFLRRVRAILQGRGITQPEDLFASVARGERGKAVTPADAVAEFFEVDKRDARLAVKIAEEDLGRIQLGLASRIREDVSGRYATPENVTVVEPEASRDLNPLKRPFLVPSALFKGTPALARAVQRWSEANNEMQAALTRIVRDWTRIQERLSAPEFADLTLVMFRGGEDEVTYTADDLRNLTDENGGRIVLSDKTIDAYVRARRLIERAGRLVDQHERAMRPLLRNRVKPILIRQVQRLAPVSAEEADQLLNARYLLRAQLRAGKGDIEALQQRLAEIHERLGYQAGSPSPVAQAIEQLDIVDAQLARTSVRRHEGYVPHKFFGSWAVYRAVEEETDEGTTIRHELVADYAEHGFHPDRGAAIRAARAYAALHPDEEIVVRPTQFKFAGPGGAELPMPRYQQLMGRLEKAFGVEGAELREAMQGTVRPTSRRRWAGFKQQRLGIEGYSRDLDRVLRTHFGEVVRYVFMDKVKYEAVTLRERLGLTPDNRQRRGLSAAFEAYVRDVLGEKQPLEASVDEIFARPWATPLRVGMTAGLGYFMATGGITGNPLIGMGIGSYMGWRHYVAQREAAEAGGLYTRTHTGVPLSVIAHLKLGSFFNLFSPLVNLTQVFLNTSSVLPYRYVMRGYKGTLKAIAGDQNLRRLLDRHNIDPVFKHSEVNPHMFDKPSKIGQLSMWAFDGAEKINRATTFLGAYYRALDRGQTPGEAQRYAASVLARTQFDYSAAMKPEILRNVFARVPLQFKNFVFQQINFAFGLRGAELPKFLAHMFIVAGVLGLPGLQLLDWLMDWLFGYSPIDQVKRIALDMQAQGELPGTVMAAIARGLPALIGMDISTRAGMGDKFLPRLEADDMIGPGASTLVRAGELAESQAGIVDQLRNLSSGLGAPFKALETLANGLPIEVAFTNPAAYWRALADDDLAMRSPYKRGAVEVDESTLSLPDVAQMAFGGTPLSLSQHYDWKSIARRRGIEVSEEVDGYMDRIARAFVLYQETDPARFADEAAEIVKEAQAEGVMLSPRSVRQMLRDSQTPAALRQIKDARRQLRPELYELQEGLGDQD